MKRFGKVLASIVAVMLFCVLVLFFPYSIEGIPEWKLEIVDQNGQPAVGAQVEQEWIDPDREGQGNPMDIKGLWPRWPCRVSGASCPRSPRQSEAVYALHTRVYLLEWAVGRYLLVWRNATSPNGLETEGHGLPVRLIPSEARQHMGSYSCSKLLSSPINLKMGARLGTHHARC